MCELQAIAESTHIRVYEDANNTWESIKRALLEKSTSEAPEDNINMPSPIVKESRRGLRRKRGK